MTSFYRYIIDHDMGFSPNPFHGFCTLANCKPVIRRCAQVGDFVLGYGAARSGIAGKLIYWMRVEEKIRFHEYWKDPRFQLKKPVLNASLIKFYGDNIYWIDNSGIVRQDASFHSYEDGSVNKKNLSTDTDSTDKVLISRQFGYYGYKARVVPEQLRKTVPRGRGHRRFLPKVLEQDLEAWILNDLPTGFHNVPLGWVNGK